jgi:hypothetical protein
MKITLTKPGSNEKRIFVLLKARRNGENIEVLYISALISSSRM